MSMLDDPWRMAIPNPDEVLNGAFAIDGSLSVRGIYADEIRLRKGATYSDFLTSVGTLDDYEGDVRPGYTHSSASRAPCATSTGAARRCRAWSPSSTGATGRSFFAWFDHFKVNIRALSADRTGETPETTGGGRIPTAPDVLPDRSDWAKTQNWALKDHFHDERYALVKHPHVKATSRTGRTATCTTTSSAGPRCRWAGAGQQRLGWRRLRREGMDKVAGLATSTAIFGGALIVGGIKYYKDRKGFVRQIDELNARPPIKFDTEDAQREYYKLENEKKQWSELKDKEMTEVAEKKAEANKLMTDAQRQEESALTALRSAERQVAEERTKMILDAEEELKRINEQRKPPRRKSCRKLKR
eukprot:tig00000203_g17108.t1